MRGAVYLRRAAKSITDDAGGVLSPLTALLFAFLRL